MSGDGSSSCPPASPGGGWCLLPRLHGRGECGGQQRGGPGPGLGSGRGGRGGRRGRRLRGPMEAAGGALREAAGVRALQVTRAAQARKSRESGGPSYPSPRPGVREAALKRRSGAGRRGGGGGRRAAQRWGRAGSPLFAVWQAGGGVCPCVGSGAGGSGEFRAARRPSTSGHRLLCGGAGKMVGSGRVGRAWWGGLGEAGSEPV